MAMLEIAQDQKWRVGLALRVFNGSLRQRREAKGWTQKVLAVASGVNLSMINGAESMRLRPSPESVRKIADALECAPADIWPDWLKPDPTRKTVRVYRQIEEIAFSALESRWKQMVYALPSPDEVGAIAETKSLKDALRDAMATLTPRQQKVLTLRFGLDDGCPRTLKEVGSEFGITHERIRQIEIRALRKLRHPSRSKRLREFVE